MKTLIQKYNKILDDLFKLNQEAVKKRNNSIKSKTCYLLEIAEQRLK